MATQTVIGSGSTRNNGGTILYGGTIASTRWDSLVFSTNIHSHDVPNRLIPASTAHMVKPLSAGVYGSMEAGKYVAKILGERIAQTSNTVLQSGASAFYRMPIKPKESERRIHITSWNAVTGAPTYGGSRGNSYDFGNIDSGTFIDQAAHPSRAVPGELVYMVTGNEATLDDYKAITQK